MDFPDDNPMEQDLDPFTNIQRLWSLNQATRFMQMTKTWNGEVEINISKTYILRHTNLTTVK